VLAVDPPSGSTRRAVRLPRALSDAAAVAVPGGILVVGGRDAHGRVRNEILMIGRGS
jgi:N-acetylneuraminic acid mutarotase